MKEKIRMSVIGLGQRGLGLLRGVLVKRDDAEVVAVCDVYSDRVEQSLVAIREATGKTAVGYTDYREMLEKERPDAVLVSAAWEYHTEIAVKCGILSECRKRRIHRLCLWKTAATTKPKRWQRI